MSDHADAIFKAWQHGGWMGARPLIDALVAERDEALRRLETTGVVELHERCEDLLGALLDLIEFACRMPGYSLHPQTERARDALAKEDTDD